MNEIQLNEINMSYPVIEGIRETVPGHFENEAYIFFWNGPFSNWHISTFDHDTNSKWGITKFTSSEQAMMFYKALWFNDEDSLIKILSTHSPREQKALGRKVNGFDQEIWESKIELTFSNVLVDKFSSDPILTEILLDSESKTIVEASPYDTVWGIGLGVDSYDILDESKWKGKNLLGKCLMNARTLLQLSRNN